MSQHHGAARGIDDVLEHFAFVGRVQRNVDGAQIVDREPGEHDGSAAWQPNEDAIPFADPARL